MPRSDAVAAACAGSSTRVPAAPGTSLYRCVPLNATSGLVAALVVKAITDLRVSPSYKGASSSTTLNPFTTRAYRSTPPGVRVTSISSEASNDVWIWAHGVSTARPLALGASCGMRYSWAVPRSDTTRSTQVSVSIHASSRRAGASSVIIAPA